MNPKSAPDVVNLMLRIALGLTMMMMGISAYRDLAPFMANVTEGLEWASSIGTVWGYFLPAFLLFGGGMLLIGRYSYVTAWVGGIALASVPAGILLKTIIGGLPLPDMLAASYPSIVWLFAFAYAISTGPQEPEAEEENA
jgi:hypothetical protein